MAKDAFSVFRAARDLRTRDSVIDQAVEDTQRPQPTIPKPKTETRKKVIEGSFGNIPISITDQDIERMKAFFNEIIPLRVGAKRNEPRRNDQKR